MGSNCVGLGSRACLKRLPRLQRGRPGVRPVVSGHFVADVQGQGLASRAQPPAAIKVGASCSKAVALGKARWWVWVGAKSAYTAWALPTTTASLGTCTAGALRAMPDRACHARCCAGSGNGACTPRPCGHQEHGQHIGATMRLVGGVGHGQQAAHGQDGHLAAKGQPLGHGAGGAQAGKSAGALSKNNSCKRLWGKR